MATPEWYARLKRRTAEIIDFENDVLERDMVRSQETPSEAQETEEDVARRLRVERERQEEEEIAARLHEWNSRNGSKVSRGVYCVLCVLICVTMIALLTADGQAVFTPDPLGDEVVPEGNGLSYGPMRLFREMDCRSGAVLTAAHHLWQWMRRNRFCGGCGGRMEHDGAERALRCPACGQVNYPMIAPAIIVALTCGDAILLAKSANSPWKHYGLVAGYVEVGETLEQAVRREVKEEVGLPVHHLRYVGSQPWGVSGSLMCAFQGETDSSLPLKIQRSELADAKWVSRGQLSAPASTFSVAQELIERFRQGKL